jgi:hypothetical protein
MDSSADDRLRSSTSTVPAFLHRLPHAGRDGRGRRRADAFSAAGADAAAFAGVDYLSVTPDAPAITNSGRARGVSHGALASGAVVGGRARSACDHAGRPLAASLMSSGSTHATRGLFTARGVPRISPRLRILQTSEANCRSQATRQNTSLPDARFSLHQARRPPRTASRRLHQRRG